MVFLGFVLFLIANKFLAFFVNFMGSSANFFLVHIEATITAITAINLMFKFLFAELLRENMVFVGLH